MIEAQILRMIEDEDGSAGAALNDLVGTFRRGRDVRELLPLLDSDHAELVSITAWILGELPWHLYNHFEFTGRLQTLLSHPEPRVRFNALGALFPDFAANPLAAHALIAKLRTDPNEGVRMSAQAAARRLSLI